MVDVFIRDDVATFLTFLNAVPGPRTHEVPPTESRAMMAAMRDVADAPVGVLAVNREIEIPGPQSIIKAQIFDARESREAGPVMVFYHGGGFVIGDIFVYEPYCAEVARQIDLPVISVDYRLAPEHPFPAAADDCEAATRWIAESPAELGYKVTGLITSGDSAGGNLTIVTTMSLRDRPAAVPVLLQHPIYPVVSDHGNWQSAHDFAEGYLLTRDMMEWFTKLYAADMSEYRGAPLLFDQSGMPPSLVTTASLDPLRDQGLAYVDALKKAGVNVQHISADGNIHGHINLRKGIPSSQGDIDNNMNKLMAMLEEVLR